MSGSQAPNNHTMQQQQPPFKRQLPFSSIKPPILAPGEYHRFGSAASRGPTDQDADAIVVKSPQLKRKFDGMDHDIEPGEWPGGLGGYTEVFGSPLETPVSAKGGKAQKMSRSAKSNKSTPKTPISNLNHREKCSDIQLMRRVDNLAGSPSGHNLTPAGPCRYDSSLGLLTKKFINLIQQAEDGILDLNKAANTLEVQKRRIYDITNVLEGIGLIEKKLKNRIYWKGFDVSRPGEPAENVVNLQAELHNLAAEEQKLDERISEMQERLRGLSEDENNQKWLFITEEDIKSLQCFQNETLIAIKAPHGTTLEVPDPDEAVDYPQRRYRIVLRSTMGPIDVYLVSQFEEKFEELHGAEGPAGPPSDSGFTQYTESASEMEQTRGKNVEMPAEPGAHRMCSEATSSQDIASGITKIVPSEIDADADYWLLSDAGVSITDMWRIEPGVEWNDFSLLHEECDMGNANMPQPQTPPSNATEAPPATSSGIV